MASCGRLVPLHDFFAGGVTSDCQATFWRPTNDQAPKFYADTLAQAVGRGDADHMPIGLPCWECWDKHEACRARLSAYHFLAASGADRLLKPIQAAVAVLGDAAAYKDAGVPLRAQKPKH